MRTSIIFWSIPCFLIALTQCGPGIGPVPGIVCSAGTTWSTLEEWVPYPAAITSLVANGLAFNQSGAIFVVVSTSGGGLPRATAVTRKLSGTGTDGAVVDSFTYGLNDGAQYFNTWTDGSQTVFVQGVGFDASARRHWLIRRSDDDGATWTTTDDFQFDPAYDSAPGFNHTPRLQLPNGDWLIQGQGDDASSTHTLVRKSTDQGGTWSTLFDYQYQTGYATSSRTIARDSSGFLYLGAQGTDSAGTTHWLVLKSSDSGVSWTLVDDYVHGVGQISGVKGILPISGALIVTGTGFNSSGTNHWITRRSTDGGTSWATVDVIADSVAQTDPVLDDRGYLYIGGVIGLSPNRTATVRRSTDGGITWSTVDSIPTYTYGLSAIRSMNRGADGSIYAMGTGVDSSLANHVMIRKLPCN